MIPEQNTQEWKEWRRDKIGASDASIVLGISPWSSPLQLYEEKLGIRSPKDLTAAMARGMDLEEKARIAYERLSGKLVFPQVRVHPHFEWCIASLDGMTMDERHIVEIKVPGQKTHEMAKAGKVPDHYYSQLQHQMFVTNLKSADYFSFDGESGMLIVVERDESFIANMVKEELKFMECLINMSPPPLNEKDYLDKTGDIEFRSSEYQCSQLDDQIKELCDQLKNLEAKRDVVRAQMISLSNGQNAKGTIMKMTKRVSKGHVDYKKIEVLKNVNLDKYRKPNVISYIFTNL